MLWWDPVAIFKAQAAVPLGPNGHAVRPMVRWNGAPAVRRPPPQSQSAVRQRVFWPSSAAAPPQLCCTAELLIKVWYRDFMGVYKLTVFFHWPNWNFCGRNAYLIPLQIVSGGTHLLRPRSCFTTLAFVPAHLPRIPRVDTWRRKTCKMKMALQTLRCSVP